MTDQTYFADRNRPATLGNIVVITDDKDGSVHFSRDGGGWVNVLPRDEFAARFAQVTPEELERMRLAIEPIDVCLGDDEAYETLRGYSNGRLWNGWQVPYFSLETISAAVEDGGFLETRGMNRVSRFLHLPETNDLLEIGNWEGGEFTSEPDMEKVREIALRGLPIDEAEKAYAEIGLIVGVADRFDILEEGSDTPKRVFSAGDGWTWERGPEPAVEPVRSRGPGM